jgi:large subunit ribosomal protein L7/L12
LTGWGLKEAKDFVDAVASGPKLIKSSLPIEAAEALKAQIVTAGGTVELK